MPVNKRWVFIGPTKALDPFSLIELVQHYGYLPFGNERCENNSQAFSVTNRYTGQHLDEETGLYFYGSRYYDPELARFIQPDSIVPDASSQGLNRYTYCINNPLLFVDPSGHAFDPVTLGIIVGAIVGGGMSAAQGGDIWMGALAGAIAGAFGGYGWANFGADNLVAFALCNAAGGALGALVTGGDPGMAAVTAAISSTVSLGLFNDNGILGSFSGSPTEQYFKQLTASTGVGALMGGISAEIFGGSFGEGAMWGASAAAASFALSKALSPTESEKEKGARGLSKAKPEMEKRCEACYIDQADIDQCKNDAARIVEALARTWNHNFGRPTVSGEHRVGGYFCWDWEAAFYDAANSIGSSCWNVSHGMLDYVHSDLVHYYVELSTRTGGGIVRIDDGFMGNTGFVHDRSWPGSPSWSDIPWVQPYPAPTVPGIIRPFSYTYPRIEGVPGIPSGR